MQLERAVLQEKKPQMMRLEALSQFFGRKNITPGKPPKGVAELGSEYEFEVTQSHEGWYLCSSAEYRMERAIKNQATVLVNGFLLTKFVGKMSALAIKDIKIRDVTFEKGCWYSPVDELTRTALRNAFDEGNPDVDIPKGRWLRVREFDGENLGGINWQWSGSKRKREGEKLKKKFWSLVNSYVKTSRLVPDTFNNGRHTRKEFRTLEYENG